MIENNLIKHFALAASSLGIVQGVVWFILALLSILIRFGGWNPEPDGLTYGASLSWSIIINYLTGSPSSSNSLGATVFIRPQEFYIWAILFMAIAVFWIGLSIYLLVVIFKRGNARKVFLSWSIWTVVVCVADLIFVILLSIDYNSLTKAFNQETVKRPIHMFEILSCGVIILLASRGVILWFVNLIFAIIMFKLRIEAQVNLRSLTNCSTSSETFLRPTSPYGEIRFHSNKIDRAHSFSRFQGLPRIQPVHSTNQNVAYHSRQFPFNYESASLSSSYGPPKPAYIVNT